MAAQLLEVNLVDELVMIVALKFWSGWTSLFNFMDRLMESLFKGRFIDTEPLGEDIVMRVRFGE